MPFKPGVSGNPKGRTCKPAIEILNTALVRLETIKHKHLITKCVEDAYKDKQVAIAILKKIIPDMQASDVKVSGGQLTINFIPKVSQVKTIENSNNTDNKEMKSNNEKK